MQRHRVNIGGCLLTTLQWAGLGAALGSMVNVGWGTFLGLPAGVIFGTLFNAYLTAKEEEESEQGRSGQDAIPGEETCNGDPGSNPPPDFRGGDARRG
jgi:hypothetical protein